jgi:hypothetical protein
VVSLARLPPLLHAEHLVSVDIQLSHVTSSGSAFLAHAARSTGGLVAARGRRASPSSPPAEQLLEPVHQPRLEAAAPARVVGVSGDGAADVLAVPEPGARDAEAGGLAWRAVDGRRRGVLLLGAPEAGAESREIALEGLDAGAGGLHGSADARGLAQRVVALENVAERHAGVAAAERAGEVGALEERRRRRGSVVVVVAGEEHGLVGVELLHEHGLHDEAEREARVLDQVHEHVLRQLGAVHVVAQPALLLLRQLPLVALHTRRHTVFRNRYTTSMTNVYDPSTGS